MSNSVRHPTGFTNLAVNEIFDRLSFYGLISMVVVVFIRHFNFTDSQAYQLFGALTTLAFLMPTIGGFITDKCIYHSKSIFLGLTFSMLGNVAIAFFTFKSIFIGFSLLICGIGLLKANNASLLGFLYKSEDKRKEGGFTLFYMGMNIGAVLGPLIYGFLSIEYGWRWGFLFSALGLGIMAFFYYRHMEFYNEIERKNGGNKKLKAVKMPYLFIGLLVIVALIYFLLTHLNLFTYAVLILAFIILAIIFSIILRQKKPELKKMLFLLILNIFAIFYFACQNQISSSLMLFISNYSNLGYLSSKIPSQIFASLEPLFVIISAPLLARLLRKLYRINVKHLAIIRVFLSILVAGISFLLFRLSVEYGINHFSIFILGIVIGSFCLGLGELFIGPALLSAVTYLISKKYQGTFMGIWSLSIAFSGFLGGLIAQVTAHQEAGMQSVEVFSEIFKEIAIIMGVVLLLFILTIPLLNFLVREAKDK